jgi:hypothetical protein
VRRPLHPLARPGPLAVVLAALLVVSACDPADTDDDPADPDPTEDVTDDDPDDADPDDPAASPDDVDEVDELDLTPEDRVSVDELVASAEADLPDGWEITVVEDELTSPFVLGLPDDVLVWAVEQDPDEVLDAVEGTAWGDYWGDLLEAEDTSGSSVRAFGVDTALVDDDVVSVQVTISPADREQLPLDDPEALAEAFEAAFEEQGLSAIEAGTRDWADTQVAAVEFDVPEDAIGAPRRAVQWFFPEPGVGVLWSVTCDTPPDPDAEVEALCDGALASFRPPTSVTS